MTGEKVHAFLVGLQDSDKGVYEITASGASASSACYDGGGLDVRGFAYDETNKILWYVSDNDDKLVGYNTVEDCEVAIFDTPSGATTNEEGLAIDFTNSIMYIASDGTDGTSFVAIYEWPGSGMTDCSQTSDPCGNSMCESTEDCNTCSLDCNGRTGGKPSNRFCCSGGACTGPGCSSSIDCAGTGVTTTCSFTTCDGGGTGPVGCSITDGSECSDLGGSTACKTCSDICRWRKGTCSAK